MRYKTWRVRQGRRTSPTLFNICISQLAISLEESLYTTQESNSGSTQIRPGSAVSYKTEVTAEPGPARAVLPHLGPGSNHEEDKKDPDHRETHVPSHYPAQLDKLPVEMMHLESCKNHKQRLQSWIRPIPVIHQNSKKSNQILASSKKQWPRLLSLQSPAMPTAEPSSLSWAWRWVHFLTLFCLRTRLRTNQSESTRLWHTRNKTTSPTGTHKQKHKAKCSVTWP